MISHCVTVNTIYLGIKKPNNNAWCHSQLFLFRGFIGPYYALSGYKSIKNLTFQLHVAPQVMVPGGVFIYWRTEMWQMEWNQLWRQAAERDIYADRVLWKQLSDPSVWDRQLIRWEK